MSQLVSSILWPDLQIHSFSPGTSRGAVGGTQLPRWCSSLLFSESKVDAVHMPCAFVFDIHIHTQLLAT